MTIAGERVVNPAAPGEAGVTSGAAGDVRERPILFSGPMVRAILEGRKTQTRRLLKAAAAEIVGDLLGQPKWYLDRDPDRVIRCPYGALGDRLWVREAWRAEERESDAVDGVRFRADDSFREIENTRAAADAWVYVYNNGKHGNGWRPGIHMPRWASRLTLELTDVRVQRLQDIDEADARAARA